MKYRKLKLSRVCAVSHVADTRDEFLVVRHPDNTSPNTLDYKSPHVSAVCITTYTLNNLTSIFYNPYFILQLNSKF
jgi:hypothetical protein